MKYYEMRKPDGSWMKGQFLTEEMVEHFKRQGYTLLFNGRAV